MKLGVWHAGVIAAVVGALAASTAAGAGGGRAQAPVDTCTPPPPNEARAEEARDALNRLNASLPQVGVGAGVERGVSTSSSTHVVVNLSQDQTNLAYLRYENCRDLEAGRISNAQWQYNNYILRFQSIPPEDSPEAQALRREQSSLSTPTAPATVARVESSGGDHLLLDVDLGVPVGVRVGYDFGHGAGIGVRAGVGPAINSSMLAGVMLAAFGAIPLTAEGNWRLEPTLGLAVVSSSAGFVGGLGVHWQFTDKATGPVPNVGARAGLNVAYVSSSIYALPEAALVLSW